MELETVETGVQLLFELLMPTTAWCIVTFIIETFVKWRFYLHLKIFIKIHKS
jgi:hypothetical protein